MMQTSHSNMNKYEYEFLTGTWEGVKGAAYNATYEFCQESGWCAREGTPTPRGLEKIKEFEGVRD